MSSKQQENGQNVEWDQACDVHFGSCEQDAALAAMCSASRSLLLRNSRFVRADATRARLHSASAETHF
jgi:hypothetical protein